MIALEKRVCKIGAPFVDMTLREFRVGFDFYVLLQKVCTGKCTSAGSRVQLGYYST